MFVAGWLRADDNSSVWGDPAYSGDHTFIECQQKMKVAPFNARADASVIYQKVSSWVRLTTTLTMTTCWTKSYLNGLSNSTLNNWHNETLAEDWNSYLLTRLANSTDLIDPQAPPPDAARAIALMTDLLQRPFAITLSLKTDFLHPASKNLLITGSRISHEYRIFKSPLMFRIAITILSLDLGVAVAFYYHTRDRFLPRMPTSIASVIGFLYSSRGLHTDAEDNSQAAKAQRFGYGRVIGVDGWSQVGIERHPFVVSLDDDGVPRPTTLRKRS
ncbi:hypothetical protein MMC16_007666 [Acarospora aff. strigata]|nr:hypothetical protein [Acarospora aff. strigata]